MIFNSFFSWLTNKQFFVFVFTAQIYYGTVAFEVSHVKLTGFLSGFCRDRFFRWKIPRFQSWLKVEVFVDVFFGKSSSFIHRENGGTLGIYPINSHYRQVYMGWIIKATIFIHFPYDVPFLHRIMVQRKMGVVSKKALWSKIGTFFLEILVTTKTKTWPPLKFNIAPEKVTFPIEK